MQLLAPSLQWLPVRHRWASHWQGLRRCALAGGCLRPAVIAAGLCSGRLCWQASASLRKRRKELEAAQQNESKKLSNLEEARGALGAAGCSADGGPRGPLRPLHGSLR